MGHWFTQLPNLHSSSVLRQMLQPMLSKFRGKRRKPEICTSNDGYHQPLKHEDEDEGIEMACLGQVWRRPIHNRSFHKEDFTDFKQ